MIFTVDTETCYKYDEVLQKEVARVWAWGTCNIKTFEYQDGNNLDSLFDFLKKGKENHTMYFHNLKYDGKYILYWLNQNGYKWIRDSKYRSDKTYTTLISDMGQFYSIEIYFSVKGNKSKKVTFFDSMKLLNFSVEEIANTFKLSIKKGSIDYELYRDVDHEITEEERAYLKNDVEIVARGLSALFKLGMDKMTIGSCAMSNFKSMYGKDKFERDFPVPYYDEFVRDAYYGGYVWVNPKYQGVTIGEGYTLDVNSLYPWAMRYCLLPYGEGLEFKGEYKENKKYPLYIVTFSCCFFLKEGKIPTIQSKACGLHGTAEYMTSSNNEIMTLTLTSVDLALFFECYDVDCITWFGGYMFKGKRGFFDEYIDFWTEQKIKAKREKNHGLYITAKLMLNNLYGKFSTSPKANIKIPIFDDTGFLRFYDTGKNNHKKLEGSIPHDVYEELAADHMREPVYIPMGAFITAYAREKTQRSILKVGLERFLYCDTDSIHIKGLEPVDLEIDSEKLGYWDNELVFEYAKYLRPKTYIELPHRKHHKVKKKSVKLKNVSRETLQTNYCNKSVLEHSYFKQHPLKITCAGLTKKQHKQVTFSNFTYGAVYFEKLKPKNVYGGVILEKTTFEIKNLKKGVA